MVACGMIFSALSIFSAGTVADSKPRKAKSVRAAVADIAWKLLLSLTLNGVK